MWWVSEKRKSAHEGGKEMLHISVAEMLVNNLSAPHADMPVEVAQKPALFASLRRIVTARFDRMGALVQVPPQVLPVLDDPIAQL